MCIYKSWLQWRNGVASPYFNAENYWKIAGITGKLLEDSGNCRRVAGIKRELLWVLQELLAKEGMMRIEDFGPWLALREIWLLRHLVTCYLPQLLGNLPRERKNDNPGQNERIRHANDAPLFTSRNAARKFEEIIGPGRRVHRPLFGSCSSSHERPVTTDSRFQRRDIETYPWYAGWERK